MFILNAIGAVILGIITLWVTMKIAIHAIHTLQEKAREEEKLHPPLRKKPPEGWPFDV